MCASDVFTLMAFALLPVFFINMPVFVSVCMRGAGAWLKIGIKMSKYDMREAIYSQSEGAIVPRSKSVVWPVVVTMVGVGLLVLNAMIEATVQNGNLKSALLLFGAVFAIAGVVMVVVRLSGASKAPYCVKDGCFLDKKELKFAKEQKNIVVDLLCKGDFATLRSLKQSDVSALTVVEYSSPKSRVVACQAFEYLELELRPVSDLVLKVE